MPEFTSEPLRILRAADEGRLYTDERGFWLIEGEEKPIYCERAWLMAKGYLEARILSANLRHYGLPTEAGREALEAACPG